MVTIICALIGAFYGTLRAKKRDGNRLDILQYGAVYTLIFALIGLFLTIIIERNI